MRYYTTLCSKRKLDVSNRCCRLIILLCAIIWVICVLYPAKEPTVGYAGRSIGLSAAAPLPVASPLEQPCHLLLRSPVGAGALNNVPDRFYPYASTGQGNYQVHHGVAHHGLDVRRSPPHVPVALAMTHGAATFLASRHGHHGDTEAPRTAQHASTRTQIAQRTAAMQDSLSR